MALSLVTPPSGEPVSIAEAKAQCRQDITDEDGGLDVYITAAREYAETFTHRSFLTTVWDETFDDFPCSGSVYGDPYSGIWLSNAPLISVTSVSYVDGTGATVAWANTNYTVDAPVGPKARRGRIVANYNVPYPVTRNVPNAMTVRFSAGYGAAAAVPAGIKLAIKMLAAHWFENRAPVVVSESRATMLEVPMTVESLLWPYKAF